MQSMCLHGVDLLIDGIVSLMSQNNPDGLDPVLNSDFDLCRQRLADYANLATSLFHGEFNRSQLRDVGIESHLLAQVRLGDM